MKKLLLIALLCAGCVTTDPAPFVPYYAYNFPPPGGFQRNNGPTSLRCIDNSNIFVHCNEGWWWAGPNRGWIPTGGGWYPWPKQIWPDKVHQLYNPQQLNGNPVPAVPYPY